MIVFPMAGLSRRFTEAGYQLPKYMLPIGQGFCFDRAVAGFLEAYGDDTFLFVLRDVHGTSCFVEDRCRALGIGRWKLVVLDDPTSGQGETVERGLEVVGSEPGELAIFNVDTFRHNVGRPPAALRGDGWLEVVSVAGDNWSFVLPDPNREGRALRTTEKDRVSDLCCTGFYAFGSAERFRSAMDMDRDRPASSLSETYIAPIYNHLIQGGFDIRYRIVPSNEVTFCGVPDEYEALLQTVSSQPTTSAGG